MHGLQMASKTRMTIICDNSKIALKMQQVTILQHPNIATKHMEVIYRRCLTKDEH